MNNKNNSANIENLKGYSQTDNGEVWYCNGKEHYQVCDKLEIIATTHDVHDRNYGKLIKFASRGNSDKAVILPNDVILSRGDSLVTTLASEGLRIYTDGMEYLKGYINENDPEDVMTVVDQVGWADDKTFILPYEQFTTTGEKYYFNGSGAVASDYGTKGTLSQWQKHIAIPAHGNHKAMFSIMTMLASPFAEPLEHRSGGFIFYGGSSSGKTIAVKHAAGSVWGNPRKFGKQFNVTYNNFISTSVNHNGTGCCFDEISQANPNDINKIIYTLANEESRGINDRNNNAKETKTFKTKHLWTGEQSVQGVNDRAGNYTNDGLLVRVIALNAEFGEKGMWEGAEHTRTPDKARAVAKAVEQASLEYYGTAGQKLLTELVQHLDGLKEEYQTYAKKLKEGLHADYPGMESQVERALDLFIENAFAGEKAIEWGVLPWRKGDAEDAAMAMIEMYVAERGSVANRGKLTPFIELNEFMETHKTMFINVDTDPNDKPTNCVGYKYKKNKNLDEYTFLINRKVLSKVFKNVNGDIAIKQLISAGYLTETRAKVAADGKDRKRYIEIEEWEIPELSTLCPDGVH